MKRTITTLNILTIIACVVTIMALFVSICMLKNVDGEDLIAKKRAFLAFILLIPILVCHSANMQLGKYVKRRRYLFISILTLIFGNVVSGILMLRMMNFDPKI